MAWRVARSLLVLFDQINAMAPNRSKASDGTIGDAAHQGTTSDHNPRLIPGAGSIPVVTAGDFTHDPAHGADMDAISDALCASRDPRIKYVIFNRLIMSGAPGPSPWIWRTYTGSNPHTAHMHVSVVGTAVCDDQSPWTIGDDDVSKQDVLDGLAEFFNAEKTPTGAYLKNASGIVADTARGATSTRTWWPGGSADPDTLPIVPNILLTRIAATVADLAGRDLVDEDQIIRGVLAGLAPADLVAAIVAALPDDLARQVADELAMRLAS